MYASLFIGAPGGGADVFFYSESLFINSEDYVLRFVNYMQKEGTSFGIIP